MLHFSCFEDLVGLERSLLTQGRNRLVARGAGGLYPGGLIVFTQEKSAGLFSFPEDRWPLPVLLGPRAVGQEPKGHLKHLEKILIHPVLRARRTRPEAPPLPHQPEPPPPHQEGTE